MIPEDLKYEKKFDGMIILATGKSRKETHWKNKNMLYSELVEKLRVTTRTPETYEEYKKMSKVERDNIKDVGGFVGGSLKNGRRKAENVQSRTLLTLDLDYVTDINIWSTIESLWKFSVVMYSTHSHSPEKPRLRLVIPLSRPVLPDEYQAIARMLANDLGIDQFDDTTYEPFRLMYWPSTPCDIDYVFEVSKDPAWLNPDDVLDRYPSGWEDVSYWPESSRAGAKINRAIKKQEDPLLKKGVIGAFCRTYSISEAVGEFLGDVYTAGADDTRYTFTEGSTAGGVVVYEDKFSFSHHGTDPTSGILCNAFDLVRIHKFGELDDEAKEGTPANRIPSFTKMSEFASSDIKVKQTLGEERMEKSQEDFGVVETETAWVKELTYTKGELNSTIKNFRIIIENEPLLKGKIAYNEFSNRAVVLGRLPWRKEGNKSDWEDSDDDGLQEFLEAYYGIELRHKYYSAIALAFKNKAFHPVREYLNSLIWDGISRIDTLFIDYWAAQDTEYIKLITRKWLCGAVARIFVPGIKFDYMLVLIGDQGIGKSTFLQKLAGEWFTDSIQEVEGNQAVEKLMNSWIIEFGELQAFSKSESNAIKRFVSSQEDRTRLAFEKRSSFLKRQCVFAGTTNKYEFLKDPTGNRRYWPVVVNREGRSKDIQTDLEKERDQIWAEAIVLWRDKKEKLFLTEEQENLARVEQEDHREIMEKEGVILKFLDILLPNDWDEWELSKRRSFLQGVDVIKGTIKRNKICVLEVWCECFEKNKSDIKKTDSIEINNTLSSLKGWERSGKVTRFKEYGMQRYYKKKEC